MHQDKTTCPEILHYLSSVSRLISAYNSLTDKHLAGYFSNTRIRRHLQRAGLVPETISSREISSAGGG